jgi:hypothetical protein
VLGVRPGISVFQQQPFEKTYHWAHCRNTSQTSIARHDAVRLDGAIAAANEDSDFFAFNCVPFSVGDNRLLPLGVAVEPIAPASVGKVAISGVIRVLARINHSEHRFLRAVSGSTRLETSVAGEARLLSNPGRGVEPRDAMATAELGRFYDAFIGVWESDEGDVWETGQTKNIRTTYVTQQPYYEHNTVPVVNLSGRAQLVSFSGTVNVLVQPVRQLLSNGSIFDGYVLVSAVWRQPTNQPSG